MIILNLKRPKSLPELAKIPALSKYSGNIRLYYETNILKIFLRQLPPGYSTTLTIGCVDSVLYSSSSCSRLVALMVRVTPR